MKKYIELQKFLLSEIAKGKNYRLYDDEKNERVVICDAYSMWIIYSENFFLDKECFNDMSETLFESVLKNEYLAEPVKPTGNEKTLTKSHVIELSKDIWVDKKLLKYFKDPMFKGINHKSPIFVYEDKVPAGIVMPVNLKAYEKL